MLGARPNESGEVLARGETASFVCLAWHSMVLLLLVLLLLLLLLWHF